jgi:curli biogenesis system outer membrane secretion channel CsgG
MRLLQKLTIILAVAVVAPIATVSAIDNPFGKKAGTTTEVTTGGPIAECQGQLRASIAISRFDNKAPNRGYYNNGVGDGMADMLTTALVSTGCFKVVDRQNLKGVMDEMGLQQSGLVDQATASRVGKLVGADIIVTAAVTEFEENTGGSKAKVGGGLFGKVGGVLGGLAAGSAKAHMAVDLRITDVQTSEILGATSVKGTAQDVNTGAVLGALVPGAGGLGALESWENTPRGEALRQVITGSVTSVRGMVPQGYYRHSVGRFGPGPQAMGGSSGAGPSTGGGSKVVMKAQRTLKELGLYSGTVDGLDGPGTQAAVREFQSQVGLDTTGKLDLKTVRELNSFTD